MKKPSKLIIKDSLLEKLKENSFDKCFLVRNIYSRFAIYIISTNSINTIKEEILKEFENSIDNIEIISIENDFFIVNDLEKTSKKVKGTKNIYFVDRLISYRKNLLNQLKIVNKLIKETK